MRFKKRCLSSITFFLTAVSVAMTVTPAAAQTHTPREKVLFSFAASGDLGNSPNGALISDAAGDFYGTTSGGGSAGVGAVFEITP
jgi:uncharacterized repeat protein (TIGR03803 family)